MFKLRVLFYKRYELHKEYVCAGRKVECLLRDAVVGGREGRREELFGLGGEGEI